MLTDMPCHEKKRWPIPLASSLHVPFPACSPWKLKSFVQIIIILLGSARHITGVISKSVVWEQMGPLVTVFLPNGLSSGLKHAKPFLNSQASHTLFPQPRKLFSLCFTLHFFQLRCQPHWEVFLDRPTRSPIIPCSLLLPLVTLSQLIILCWFVFLSIARLPLLTLSSTGQRPHALFSINLSPA